MSSHNIIIDKGIKKIIQETIEQIINKGREKEKVEVIKNLRLEGSTIEFIAKIVNVPFNRVRQILDELGIE